MATSSAIEKIKLEMGGSIDPQQVSAFFSEIGKLNKKKMAQLEQRQVSINPQMK